MVEGQGRWRDLGSKGIKWGDFGFVVFQQVRFYLGFYRITLTAVWMDCTDKDRIREPA